MHREEYISFLKVISALAVVLLHANGECNINRVS